jgi:1,4-alpha-glucan branching enzyme
MASGGVISLVINAHLPFVRNYQKNGAEYFDSIEEDWFFEALSETYIPLLEVFERLEGAHIPFRLGLALSPLLCQMMADESLIQKYLAYTDRQIEFGKKELERTESEPQLHKLAKMYFDLAVERKIAFTGRYACNILDVFDYYQRKGRIEILCVPATNAFLPFLSSFPESIHAQIETALSCYRQYFNRSPQGFWLPELGWTGELGLYLRSYNFTYTLVDTHGFVFGKPYPRRGSFYPVKSPHGVFIFSRDFYAANNLGKVQDTLYRDNDGDAGYELSTEELSPLVSGDGMRMRTGFKYYSSDSGQFYEPQKAEERAKAQACIFLEAQRSRLSQAAGQMDETPLCLCTCNADTFGCLWYEGPRFLEELFRLTANCQDIQFMTPFEYLYKQDLSLIETSTPEYSSSGINGYSQTWLDSSNDWVYRHLAQAQDRMVELAQRFPDESSLRERALNQAARELLLAQCSDWPRLLYNQESTEYAHTQIEDALRNFTTIYEALGSSYISTDWLTKLERRHNVFPHINYRVFRRKQ